MTGETRSSEDMLLDALAVAGQQRDDALATALAAIRRVPRRTGTPEWSTGAAVAQAAGYDMGLAVAADAVAELTAPHPDAT